MANGEYWPIRGKYVYCTRIGSLGDLWRTLSHCEPRACDKDSVGALICKRMFITQPTWSTTSSVCLGDFSYKSPATRGGGSVTDSPALSNPFNQNKANVSQIPYHFLGYHTTPKLSKKRPNTGMIPVNSAHCVSRGIAIGPRYSRTRYRLQP